MFGYVTPCKMELKMKDYEKFKAYYCGLCRSIKKNYGNFPRITLNYDMTFLAILLDSFSKEERELDRIRCIVHPTEKKIIIKNNKAIDYAAYCNIILSYYKLLDDANDDKKLSHKLMGDLLKRYLKNNKDTEKIETYIKNSLSQLSAMESGKIENLNLDKISHPFADLTGFLISNYALDKNIKESLYFLGYNIGKWIYLIDAFDDLEKDMKENKFNAINNILNVNQLSYLDFSRKIEERIDFILTTCGANALNILQRLPIKRNIDLLYNIIQFGLMEKMDKVFKRSEKNERSL